MHSNPDMSGFVCFASVDVSSSLVVVVVAVVVVLLLVLALLVVVPSTMPARRCTVMVLVVYMLGEP